MLPNNSRVAARMVCSVFSDTVIAPRIPLTGIKTPFLTKKREAVYLALVSFDKITCLSATNGVLRLGAVKIISNKCSGKCLHKIKPLEHCNAGSENVKQKYINWISLYGFLLKLLKNFFKSTGLIICSEYF
jgi:hypothetical protein